MDTPNDTPSAAKLGDNIRPKDRLIEIADHTQRAKVFAQRLDDSLVSTYLLANSPEFAKLSGLRQKGWSNPKGDVYFKNQRARSDNPDKDGEQFFYSMMQSIGEQLGRATGAFDLWSRDNPQPAVLDMCSAPGGFLAAVLDRTPTARALGFTLPPSQGGHKCLLPAHPNIEMKFLDINLLAADMGQTDIPADHPEAASFLPQQLQPDQSFDLVLCDGQVLWKHERAEYRERREARRLSFTQIALGLEHVRPGGTMVVLIHKVEAWPSICVLQEFSKFSTVRLYKHNWFHAKRSSFYMVARRIQSKHPDAVVAVEKWKQAWRTATFGTDEEYEKLMRWDERDVERVLDEFGEKVIKLGKHVWNIQAKALAKMSFTNGH